MNLETFNFTLIKESDKKFKYYLNKCENSILMCEISEPIFSFRD